MVALAEYHAARRAADVLRGLLHEPTWLLDVKVIVAEEVGFEIIVSIVREDEMIRRCLPRSMNDVPVRVIARNGASGAGRS